MAGIPKPDSNGPYSKRPAPKKANYSDEISDKKLKEIQQIADQRLDPKDEWQVTDGPAW